MKSFFVGGKININDCFQQMAANLILLLIIKNEDFAYSLFIIV